MSETESNDRIERGSGDRHAQLGCAAKLKEGILLHGVTNEIAIIGVRDNAIMSWAALPADDPSGCHLLTLA